MRDVWRIAAMVSVAAGCERASPAQVEEVHDWVDRVHCRLSDGAVECKGDNRRGIVRDPAREEVIDGWHRIDIPEEVARLDLSAAGMFACAATRSGRVYCWGDAYLGALGNGELPQQNNRVVHSARPAPQAVVGLEGVKDFGLGLRHACALTNGGAVVCWGSGAFGSLGDDNDSEPAATPVMVIAASATSIAVGDIQTCALMSTGRVLCWGDSLPDSSGVLRPALRPTEVVNVDGASAVTGDRVEMCAERRGGERRCWRTVPDPDGS